MSAPYAANARRDYGRGPAPSGSSMWPPALPRPIAPLQSGRVRQPAVWGRWRAGIVLFLWATSGTAGDGAPGRLGDLDRERSPRRVLARPLDARRWSEWALYCRRDGLRAARDRIPIGAGRACPAEARPRREARLVVRGARSSDGEHHGRLVAAWTPPPGGGQRRSPCRVCHRLVDHRPARRSACDESPLTGMRRAADSFVHRAPAPLALAATPTRAALCRRYGPGPALEKRAGIWGAR